MNRRPVISWTVGSWNARRPEGGGRRAESVFNARKIILALCITGLLATTAAAQQRHVLHAGLIKTQGYVAGSALAASGFYRYEDGETWTHVGWSIPRVSGLAYDPSNPDVLYLACGNGALRSLDGGQSWRITTDWRVTEAQTVAVDPGNPAHVYLATAYGVWATTDSGETWREANDGLPKPYTQAVAVDRAQAGRVFAGTEGGLYVSEDGGHSWLQAAPYEDVLAVQQSASDPNRWLAGTQNDGLLLSNDGGRAWHQPRQSGLRTATILAVAIDPDDAARMAAAGWNTGVLVSTDGGRSWRRRGRRLPTPHLYEVVFDPDVPGRLWAATVEKGIFYSDDLGRSWTAAGMNGTLVFDMIFIPKKQN